MFISPTIFGYCPCLETCEQLVARNAVDSVDTEHAEHQTQHGLEQIPIGARDRSYSVARKLLYVPQRFELTKDRNV